MSIKILKDEMQQELAREQRVQKFLSERRLHMPPGNLFVQCTKGKQYYYQVSYIDGKRIKIFLDPEEDDHRCIIKELMEKKTIIHGLPLLKKNIAALERCLPSLREYSPLNYPYGNQLCEKFYLDNQVCLKEWFEEKSGNEAFHPEGLVYETKSGIRVRSKSEVFIADILFDYKIAFKYEPELKLSNRIVYPDFAFPHPVRNTPIWLEHFGMMDDPEYAEAAMIKLDDYRRSGVTPGNNLIVTWETREHPLRRSTINAVLHEYGVIA